MKKIKTTHKLLIIAGISIIFVILIGNGWLSPGAIINNYWPCTQNPANSLPCYMHVDIWTTLAFLLIATISLISHGVLKFKNHLNRKQQRL